MSDKPSSPAWSVRIRSWKWWVYGDAYSKPLEKLPKGIYWQVSWCAALWVVIAFHPWVTTYINRHPPSLEQLKTVEGSIVNTYEKDPHVLFETRDGQQLKMEFPVFLNTLNSQPIYMSELGKFNRNLVGCQGRIWYDIPVGTLWKRYRIWRIDCANAISITPERIMSKSDSGLIFMGFGVFIFMPLIFIWFLLRYSRGYYERK